MMTDSVLGELSIDELATRLSISTRQLRRYFVNEIGAPPIAITQTHRLLFAKKLIDETTLSMTDVAFSAGYSSVRRFNEAIRQTYGRTPSALRNSRRNRKHQVNTGYIQLKLFYSMPYDWTLMMEFLHQRALFGVEIVEDNVYKHTVKFDNTIGTIEVQPVQGERYCFLRVPNNLSRHLLVISERVKRLFDLRANPDLIAKNLLKDKYISKFVRKYPGIRIPGAWDGFEVAVRAILGQQVSIKTATTFCRRLIEAYGEPMVDYDKSNLSYIFPTPERIAEATLLDIGLTKMRAKTLRAFANSISSEKLAMHATQTLDNAIDSLIIIPGVGQWTANYIAMRAFGEPDAFPAGDLILRRVASGSHDSPLTERLLNKKSESWRPYRAYAAMLLWTEYAHRKRDN